MYSLPGTAPLRHVISDDEKEDKDDTDLMKRSSLFFGSLRYLSFVVKESIKPLAVPSNL